MWVGGGAMRLGGGAMRVGEGLRGWGEVAWGGMGRWAGEDLYWPVLFLVKKWNIHSLGILIAFYVVFRANMCICIYNMSEYTVCWYIIIPVRPVS